MFAEERVPLPFVLERPLDAVTCAAPTPGAIVVAFHDPAAKALRVEVFDVEREELTTLARLGPATPRRAVRAGNLVYLLTDRGLVEIDAPSRTVRETTIAEAAYASTLIVDAGVLVVANDYNARCVIVARDSLERRGTVRFRALDLAFDLGAEGGVRLASLRDGRMIDLDDRLGVKAMRALDPRALSPIDTGTYVFAVAAKGGSAPVDVGTFTGMLGLEPTGRLLAFDRATLQKREEGPSLPFRKAFEGARTLSKLLGIDGDGRLAAVATSGAYGNVTTELVTFDVESLRLELRHRFHSEPIDLHLIGDYLAAGLSHGPEGGAVCLLRWSSEKRTRRTSSSPTERPPPR